MSKKLLLADDSITIQKVVGITFAGGEYDLTTVGNGDAALERARIERPDLVLADVCMPGKDGYELCAALKEDPSFREISVLLLAGTFEPFDESKAHAAGADGWVTKPFESQALIKKVEELLARQSRSAGGEAEIAKEEISPAGKPVHDIWADLSNLEISAESEPAVQEEEGAPPSLSEAAEGNRIEEVPSPLSGADPEVLREALGAAAPFEMEAGCSHEGAEGALSDRSGAFGEVAAGNPVFAGFEEEDDSQEEDGEVREADLLGIADAEGSWEGSADIAAKEEEEEILLLSEGDIVEDETPGVQHYAEETIEFDLSDEETVETAVPEPITENADDRFVPRELSPGETVTSEVESSFDAGSLVYDEQESPLGDEYEEFALEGFEEESAEIVTDGELEPTRFEQEAAESDDPPAVLPMASSPEDPFQIGAADFVPSDIGSADEDDSIWGETEETPAAAPTAVKEVPQPIHPSAIEEKVAALSEKEISRIVEKVAGQVIERLAQTMLERIAWEVVPDLAEVMIKEEIRKIREEVQ